MRAINAIREDEIIDNAVVLKARFSRDDTYGYYVVSRQDAGGIIAHWRGLGGDVDRATMVTPDNQTDFWLGMQVASIGGCGAWGRAILAD